MPLLLVVGWALGVAWRMWLSRHIVLPIAHTDEDSYLNTARALAGGPGGFSSENDLLRRVGYPMLISPAFLGDRDFADSYRLVQLINAMVNSALLPWRTCWVIGCCGCAGRTRCSRRWWPRPCRRPPSTPVLP
ncbi:hypothetical protein NKG94_20240 [Micromonospora sp. M12]